MREADIVIAGGGLAGSAAAAMLGRKGFDVAWVDPHAVYPPDLRCEKLVGRQVEILRRTGLADLVLPAATLDGGCWIAHLGRVVEKRGADQYGILYDHLVNTVRAAIPATAAFVHDKVTAIANSDGRQTVTLGRGEPISARLVIIANGLNSGLRNSLGMVRDDVTRCCCITVAFDLEPPADRPFAFRALTYFPERTSARVAYLTLFPVGPAMRANLMIYRDMNDPWLQAARQDPVAAMTALMPRLQELIGGASAAGPVKVRPADLYVTRGHRQPGVVLVGDAFASSCPVTGTGADKVLTDVERLCNVHVPRWMATGGMGVDKIAAFYDDPVKLACDRRSMRAAFRARSMALAADWPWRAQRWARYLAGLALGASRFRLRSSARGA